jgi:hypothetical protein
VSRGATLSPLPCIILLATLPWERRAWLHRQPQARDMGDGIGSSARTVTCQYYTQLVLLGSQKKQKNGQVPGRAWPRNAGGVRSRGEDTGVGV